MAIQRGTWQIAKSWTRLSNWACVHVQLSQHCFFLPLSKISWPWMYGFHFWTQFYSIYLYIYSYTSITLFWLVWFCCKFWNWDVLVLQLEKEMATHSSILAWRIPGTGEPSGLPSMGSRRVGHDWSDLAAVAVAVLTTLFFLFKIILVFWDPCNSIWILGLS